MQQHPKANVRVAYLRRLVPVQRVGAARIRPDVWKRDFARCALDGKGVNGSSSECTHVVIQADLSQVCGYTPINTSLTPHAGVCVRGVFRRNRTKRRHAEMLCVQSTVCTTSQDIVRALAQSTNLLQEQFPILVEEENAEGPMENPPGRARHKPMRQVLVDMAHNLIVLVQRDHLSVIVRPRDRREHEGEAWADTERKENSAKRGTAVESTHTLSPCRERMN